MSHFNPINDKKKALIAYKEKLLQDIQYYDKSIEDFRAKHKNNSYYDDADRYVKFSDLKCYVYLKQCYFVSNI